jgi:cytochrome P450
MTSPAVYRRLTAEIDAAEKSGTLSSPATFAEASKLPYLQACIKEGLRVWPPVCGWNPRVTPPEGDEYNGIKLPSGVSVGWAPYSMQRNPAIYGPNPELFNPERWLDAPPTQLEIMNRHIDLTFYTGRYKCLGRNVALMELSKVYVELLRRYDLSLVYPAQPWYCRNASLWIQREMWTKVSKREKEEVKIFSSEQATSLELE